MKGKISLISTALFLVFSSVISSCASKKKMVDNNCLGEFEIVVTNSRSRSLVIAKNELQNYLNKLGACKTRIVSKPQSKDAKVIYLGQSRFTDKLGINPKEFKDGAFRIISNDDYMVLIGNDDNFIPPEPYPRKPIEIAEKTKEWDRLTKNTWVNPLTPLYKSYNKNLNIWEFDEKGSLNAVYEFLRMQGLRWYHPGKIGEVLPSIDKINWPQIDETYNPDFKIRDYYFYNRPFLATNDEMLWYLRLGMNKKPEMLGVGEPGHGMYLIQKREENKINYPTMYRLANGKRDIGKKGKTGYACLSSPELIKQNIDLVRKSFDILGVDAISVMPVDAYNHFCQDQRCTGKERKDRGRFGNLSNYVWNYVNTVAKEVYKTHPDKKITCFAFSSYLRPPDNITELSPNIIVGICQRRHRFHIPVWNVYKEIRQEWLNLIPSKQLMFWEYYLNECLGKKCQGLPVLSPHTIASDLKSVQNYSHGDFIEIFQTRDNRDFILATNHLNVYTTARFHWDVDQDVNQLLDEYYSKYYGPAAQGMKSFFEFCEDNWMNMAKDPNLINEAKRKLRSAKSKVNEGNFRNRIELIENYLSLYKSKK